MTDAGTVLQAALTPITLISGVGLLLVSMTNRYNHSTDRLRQLLRESDAIKPRKDDDLDHAIELIFLRVRLLRKAILLIVLSGMFSALLVLMSIFEIALGDDFMVLKSILLLIAIVMVVVSTLIFAKEVGTSMKVLGCTVNHYRSRNMVEYHQMLTTSLPPVTLISGVGLLLLAMTARYNHSTNRVRQLLRERNSIAPRENQDLNHEIDLIFERASLLRMSILTVVLSATFSGLQVLAGILECLFMLNLDVLKLGALILSIGCLLVSTIYFVKEVSLSTKAIGLSVEHR